MLSSSDVLGRDDAPVVLFIDDAGRRAALESAGPAAQLSRMLLRDPELASPEEWATSCCVIDPPRVGLGKEGTQSMLSLGPRHILYMSCDPATLARDVAALVADRYELKKLQVLDMFPQTSHIETLVLLEKSD